MKEFEKGFFCACAEINRAHDEPSIVADAIKSCGLQNHNCKEIDEYDKIQLRIINKENGMKLYGLRGKP